MELLLSILNSNILTQSFSQSFAQKLWLGFFGCCSFDRDSE